MAGASRQAGAWGPGQEMNALEALMWRIEADARLRSTITAVEILDRLPDWDRLWAAHDWGSRVVPRFRERVLEPPLGLGAPAWELADDFALERHLRRETLPSGKGFRALLDLAQEIASAPFDRAHPPWEAVLVDGLENGRAAYVLKMHHSATDGMGGIQLLGLMHSDQREPRPDKPQPDSPEARNRSGIGVLADQLGRAVRGAPAAAAGAAADAVGLSLRAARRPGDALGEGVGFVHSLGRVIAAPAADPSPLLEPRGLKWRFEAVEVPVADLRAGGKAGGGSVNAAFISALLGAFRRYHEAFAVPIEAMPVAMPISLRSDGDALGGNRFTGVRFAGPVGESDPRERIRRIQEIVVAKRDEPALDAMGLLAPALGRLPAPLLTRIGGALTQAHDLQASNFPGIQHAVYMAGARVTHVYPFGPLPGCAAMITLLSHDGTACVGANLDAAAFLEPELFATCLREGFDEVLALA